MLRVMSGAADNAFYRHGAPELRRSRFDCNLTTSVVLTAVSRCCWQAAFSEEQPLFQNTTNSLVASAAATRRMDTERSSCEV